MAKSFGRNAFTVGGLTAVSRVLGLVRDMVTAWILGASGLADVFFVAMRLPNLLRCFIAEGAVSVAFVPVFNEVKENEGLAKALQMSQAVLSLLTIILAVTVAVGEIFAPALVMLIAPGFLHNPAFETAVHLTRIMFPFIMLVSILALFMGILNSLNHFVAPAAAQTWASFRPACPRSPSTARPASRKRRRACSDGTDFFTMRSTFSHGPK